MGDAASQSQVVSAARFYIEFGLIGRIAFSELGGISSKVVSSEYIYNNAEGQTIHTKQFGKTEPPTIVLRRALDAEGSAKLLMWHAYARAGDPKARSDGWFVVMDAGEQNTINYRVHGGWCSELSIAQMKAGDTQVAMIECKVTCEEIKAPISGRV